MAFDLNDYVDVATRIQEFYERYPDGRLCTRSVTLVDEPAGAIAIAEAYRTADDPHPGVGTAWEPIPGKTSFTRDSEVQNAETAAWGRAIIAAGIPAKKIASVEEVQARQPEPAKRAARAKGATVPTPSAALPASQKAIMAYASQHSIDDETRYRITRRIAGVTSSKDVPSDMIEKVVAALKWYVEHPESLRKIEEWEREQGIEAA